MKFYSTCVLEMLVSAVDIILNLIMKEFGNPTEEDGVDHPLSNIEV